MNKINFDYYDYVIFGAGIFGLYAALLLSKKGKIAIIEQDDGIFSRASSINQLRLHNGYHYPRSIATARKASSYYNRFRRDFGFAIKKDFKQIYAIASESSKTNAREYLNFCRNVSIPLRGINPSPYFRKSSVEAAFEAEECAFDPIKLKNYFLERLKSCENVKLILDTKIETVSKKDEVFYVSLTNGLLIKTPFVINASYSGVNQINSKFNLEPLKLKYELCEIILVKVPKELKNVGLTLMDGPFFSLMPFGKSNFHSLTAVSYTPHDATYDELPRYNCQKRNKRCTPNQLANCNQCFAKPSTAWAEMNKLLKRYLRNGLTVEPQNSLFVIKPTLLTSEIDDSRPTTIEYLSKRPNFLCIFSGKLSTIYDLEEHLK